MKIDVRSLSTHLAGLAWVAVRSFVATVIGFTLAGVVLAGVSHHFLSDHHWVYGAIAVTAALAESVAAGVVLGAKRAVVTALAHGLGTLRLGRALTHLVFERMLGLAAGAESGQRSGIVARQLERVPLANAEELLTRAVVAMTGDVGQHGWFQRKVQTQLLAAVRKFTLARFRVEGAERGGIDLLRMKEELERTADEALVQKIPGGLRLWTALALVALPAVVAVQTWVLILLIHAKG
ncbi:Uncharacterized protein OS=Sorangium cellulosum (strain So ce56) GN=sce2879 PE=4 SV=1 [Gemmataceae bacterium]|nr:Uncharacterized protein OS=Sorangium cellulosum (strain So ce56) GN=sce2879 PE=4 SV=1 [Gemmataceae bacterium]VTT97465.1 Uncharacterized protein OS=Sorangium cellulosum (strain So ce56) GN=sce2879 PE=4 SV=1 [Gemmataceae bacterium]